MRVSEIFFSVQGEGVQIGLPTVFLRFFGCDLRCSWCDTMYAVEGTDFKNMEIEEIVDDINKYECNRVCITGGEPLLQEKELVGLTSILLEEGYSIVLETSGHRTPPEIFWDDNCLISMDCKCPSSAMQNRMDFSLFKKLRASDQLKFVISDDRDYQYAKEVLNDNKISANIIFQPVYNSNTDWLYDRVLEERLKNVRVLPQLHKLIWGEKRGV
ncbi:MAG: 4Fe-4S cluster-binding domain-containing protein [Candidatus Dadabacteria bacterium]|nr:4Fe-4S cluster-binding domain-containing protein [Candidatus Dadabacteria bacterium]NIS09495.1 4Fe-4S cluster-binding domain-containing protein [Candidatus Dadabacteria bacterium]NIV41092.1 4Fe-4S cluster-binding domain-containing protein [Candidatus Dadabacteria bacterium]NIY21585.1 4Fe-4S cluster-binding domain-containing protein [Candidatus Dadabacteria bacterium]